VRSLYGRIFLAFWAVMVLVVAGSIGLTWLVLTERTDELPRISGELMRGAAAALADGGEAGLVAWLQHGRATVIDIRVLIVDEQRHELLGRELPLGIERLLREPDLGLAAYPGIVVVPARPLPQLVARDGRRYGILIGPRRHMPGPLGVLLEARFAVLLLAFAVTGGASWLLTRSITRPVRALGTATRQLASGDLGVRVEGRVSARRDEFGTLARDFDAMATRLRELLAGRERLLRDVSHELRSPLARMRVALGLARQNGGQPERELERLDAEVERLDRLIGQMLHLTRLDATTAEVLREDVDLVDLLDGITRDAAFEAQARRVVVRWRPPAAGGIVVRGNGGWLASAIENVVRNALRYTDEASTVDVVLGQGTDAVRIEVRDRGPGVPEPELERIFEPFHRVAASRTRDSGGDGIGLAITARVLAAHGGRAEAANAPGGGLLVTLWLPRPGAAVLPTSESA
jgi:two-component system sensor histidine kinase CpxA